MSTPKPATRRPQFDEAFLARIIRENSPLGPEESQKLADIIMTEMRRNLGSRGGRSTKAKYGPEHYSKIGKMGGRPKAEKQEEDHA